MNHMQDKFEKVIKIYEHEYNQLNTEAHYVETKQEILTKFRGYNSMDDDLQSITWNWFREYIHEKNWTKKYLYFFIHENFFNRIDHGILGDEFGELEDIVKYEIWRQEFDEIDILDLEFWSEFWKKISSV